MGLVLALCGCQPGEESSGEAHAASASGTAHAEGAAHAEGQERRSRVETMVVEAVEFEDHLELTGVTEPVLAALVTPEIGGRVLEMALVEGEPVEQGATVLVVDTSTMGARIGSLEVQATQLQRDIERTQKLVERGLATRSDLEALESQRKVVKKQIDEVRVGKRQAVTRAPISGIVTQRLVEPGEFANGGQSVGRIVDLSTAVVRVGLPESDIRHVSQGQAVEVRIEALDRTFTGRLHRIGLEANTRNRTFPLEIRIDNPDLVVRAGMRATVRLVRGRYENAVVVPRDAILQAIEGSQVFVVDKAGLAQARDIELGPGLVRYVLVSKGLEAGERLVVRGHRALVQGEPLEVTAEQSCCATQLREYLSPEPAAEETTDAPSAPPTADAAAAASPGGAAEAASSSAPPAPPASPASSRQSSP